MSEPTCAVWFWRYHSIGVDTFDSEDSAVAFALGCEEEGSASIAGIQYADGRFVAVDDWTALDEYRDRRDAWWDEAAKRADDGPRPELRVVSPPFEAKGQTVTVDASEPSWLGVRNFVCDECFDAVYRVRLYPLQTVDGVVMQERRVNEPCGHSAGLSAPFASGSPNPEEQ